jgi:hypothetical protein
VTQLLDIVNFNPDASCLTSARWLEALDGGRDSEMCRWLRIYVEQGRPISLGMTGAGLADMAGANPEAVDLVREHPEVFEILLRPFSHDVAMLRSRAGFARNLELGRRTLEATVGRASDCFLPPEFMVTNSQVTFLASQGVRATFVNPSRFEPARRARIPTHPYRIRGVLDGQLLCIPVDGDLTRAYLDALHRWEAMPWNQAVDECEKPVAVCWRDGESIFFVPDGVAREAALVAGEAREIERTTAAALVDGCEDLPPPEDEVSASYPVHPFTDWFRESRMFGYLRRVERAEEQLSTMAPKALAYWLQAINSDILSAIEKDFPRITVRTHPPGAPEGRLIPWVIPRSERGLEGEEALELLERSLAGEAVEDILEAGSTPGLRKLRGRARFVSELLATTEDASS